MTCCLEWTVPRARKALRRSWCDATRPAFCHYFPQACFAWAYAAFSALLRADEIRRSYLRKIKQSHPDRVVRLALAYGHTSRTLHQLSLDCFAVQSRLSIPASLGLRLLFGLLADVGALVLCGPSVVARVAVWHRVQPCIASLGQFLVQGGA
jgi:hypothetical protein